jgi:hypothetical protein
VQTDNSVGTGVQYWQLRQSIRDINRRPIFKKCRDDVATELERPQTQSAATGRIKAPEYHGSGKRAWEETPRPAIQNATDAIVRITTSTICGTDLHILKGGLPRRSRRFGSTESDS